MAGLFTIRVPFYKNTNTALVSFNSVDDETFVVRYVEEEINEMIPGNKLIFTIYHGVISSATSTEPIQDLLYQTSRAISGYLQLNNSK
jgi:hypothetical protein